MRHMLVWWLQRGRCAGGAAGGSKRDIHTDDSRVADSRVGLAQVVRDVSWF